MIRSVVEWTDVDLAWIRTAWNQQDATTAAALVAALQAKSSAGIAERVEGTRVVPATAPPGGHWSSVTDLAILEFCTAANASVRLALPAPLNSIFLPGGDRQVDPAQIAAIISAALAVLTDSGGAPVVAFAGGFLQSRRRDLP